ncbi:MAG: aminodeoxychorismate/anthranilate synthase component II [Saccharofermentans sp.]|nr:aminodeoxychorismate/anthranilate synthase component II [Saccharofermentans sp.]
MILLIDNYDSFSYNLYQMIGQINPDIKVIRNDEMTVSEIIDLAPDHIILSPGPGRPEDAGVICEVAKTIHNIPILGVCLGHQAICNAYGATITYAEKLMHGKQSVVGLYAECPLFKGLDERTKVARYHSLAADRNTIPECLQVTAVADDGEIMAVKHREYPIYGVQFHPESILTPEGKKMLENFLFEC